MSVGSVSAAMNADILAWAKSQLAQWQHEALRRILHKGQLAESDYVDLLERAQCDLGIAVSPVALPDLTLTAGDLPISPSSPGRVALKALRSVENVNSLRAGAVVSFGPQLTVIYGENGSGKSGYVRILKRVGRCASRAVEAILPNVYAPPTTNVAKAVLDIETAGVPRSLSWSDGQEPPAELRRISVFDSKCALSYLGADNQVTFVPAVVDALRLLSDATDEVKRRVGIVAAAAAPAYPAALAALVGDDTNIGRSLSLLSAATNPAMLIDLGKWDPEVDENALSTKQSRLTDLRVSSPALRQAKARAENQGLRSLLSTIDKVRAALDTASVDRLKQLDGEFIARSEAYHAAVQSALGESQINGVGNDAWRSLLESAFRFSTESAYKGQPFPPTSENAACVLCQQTLTAAATSRLSTFWRFLKDDATLRRDRARDVRDADFLSMTVALDAALVDLAGLRSDLETNQADLWGAATAFLAAARKRTSSIEDALSSHIWTGVSDLDSSIREDCANRLATGEAQAGSTAGDAAIQGQMTALGAEIAELAARKRLAANLQPVQSYLDGLKHHTALKAAADSIATKALTFKAKALYATHVTAAFRLQVAQNMQRLGLQRAGIAIEEKPGKGKVLHTIKLDGAKVAAQPSAVLSEGERTAISLSYFLSDLGSVEETSVVIFDDPVTSLDHRIREGAVKAVIEETKLRQVAVFTHDLAFFHELVSRAELEQVDVVAQQVESIEQAVGLIQNSTPWDAMPVEQRMEVLERHVTKARDAANAADGDGFKNEIARFYSRLRATWERAVEEVLFNKVVSRYSKTVKTLQLDGVSVDKEGVTAIFEGMTRSSAVTDAHDHATAASVPTPTLAEVTRDLASLRQFLASQKVKRSAAVKANAHLKVKP